MERIVIKSFGPIEYVDLTLKDIVILIGPQGSGKSTVSKSVYFFRLLISEFNEVFASTMDNIAIVDNPITVRNLRKNFVIRTRQLFNQMWGTTPISDSFKMTYYYAPEKCIELTKLPSAKSNTQVHVSFSHALDKGLNNLISSRIKFESKTFDLEEFEAFMNVDSTVNSVASPTFTNALKKLLGFVDEFPKLFEIGGDTIFVPAGRSFLSFLPEAAPFLYKDSINDPCISKFLFMIHTLKTQFGISHEDMIEKARHTSANKYDPSHVLLAKEMCKSILRGTYKYDINGERLYIDDNRYVKLNYASSGQQEVVWILNLLFKLLLEKTQNLLIIEEPEAHLYPEAIKKLTELIVLFSNGTESKVMLTTHSPYILTALNTLVQAHLTGKHHPDKVKKIITQPLWLDFSKIVAFELADGQLRSILDFENNLIDAEQIDRISATIYGDFFELLNMEGAEC